jgi:ATP-dependent helicase HrpA
VLLAQQLSQQAKQLITPDHWQGIVYPAHLSPRIELLGSDQKRLATSRDLGELQQRFADQARAALREQTAFTESTDTETGEVTTWVWEPLALTQKVAGGGQAWLALTPVSEGVLLEPLPSQQEADKAHAAGVRRLIKCALAQPVAGIRKEWLKHQGLCLPWARWQRTCADLVEQLIERGIQDLSPQAAGVRSKSDFDANVSSVRLKLTGQVRDYALQTQQLLQQGQQCLALCDKLTSPTRQTSIEHTRAFIQAQLTASFVLTMPENGWRDRSRYLKAAAYRLEKISENLPLDERRMIEYEAVEDCVQQAIQRGIAQHQPERFEQIQIMATELWVMIFAQPQAQKGTASLKRLQQLLSSKVL